MATEPPIDVRHAWLELRASPVRRGLACGIVAALGVAVLHSGFTAEALSGLTRAMVLAIGALILWLSVELWRSTARGLALRDGVLCDLRGTPIARLDEIERLVRGPFAVKPSQGIVLVLRDRGPAAWVPGVWWRLGRRVGIGGMTPKAETKVLADLLEHAVAAREKGG